jgi:hypothetical protein
MPIFRALALTAAATLVATGANAATVLSVSPDSLCSSAGCLSETRRSFTQTFTAGQGVQGISSLALDRRLLGDMQNHAVRVTFQLADGTTVEWGKFTIAVLSGDVVTLGGQTFNWDTDSGALTVKLDLVLPEKGGVGGGGGFGAALGAPAYASLPASPPAFTAPAARSPAIFDRPLIAVVPEPSAWALMIAGFGGAGMMLRRRRLSVGRLH